ncbi:hypothetical protein [Mycobacterium sp. DL592]|uniref:hypothetical protein n=1 Tax=Mycobacterium sp. DL592 TaxID=2675524 RepID=UPI0014217E1B|nr:hypothetical protein [Mycobacterium sp. DL592]
MTTGAEPAQARQLIGEGGLSVSVENPELVGIVLEALPALGVLGARLSDFANSGDGANVNNNQLALSLELIGLTTSILLACIDTKCNLDSNSAPSEVDRRPRGSSNDMITRCHHDPPHCWDYNGKYIECPR